MEKKYEFAFANGFWTNIAFPYDEKEQFQFSVPFSLLPVSGSNGFGEIGTCQPVHLYGLG
jgi:hypothetical protein